MLPFAMFGSSPTLLAPIKLNRYLPLPLTSVNSARPDPGEVLKPSPCPATYRSCHSTANPESSRVAHRLVAFSLFNFELSTFNSFRPLVPNSFRIRTYRKRAHNSFRIRTSKTRHLKLFRMNTYRKTGEGARLPTVMANRSVGARHVVPSFVFLSGNCAQVESAANPCGGASRRCCRGLARRDRRGPSSRR